MGGRVSVNRKLTHLRGEVNSGKDLHSNFNWGAGYEGVGVGTGFLDFWGHRQL